MNCENHFTSLLWHLFIVWKYIAYEFCLPVKLIGLNGRRDSHEIEERPSFFWFSAHTIRNLHFLSENSTLTSRENCRFFWGWKIRENVVVLDFLAVDNFDFTRKIVKKKFGWKTRGVLSKLNFWTKIWLFE